MTVGLREHLVEPVKVVVLGSPYFLPVVLHKLYTDYKGVRSVEVFTDISSQMPSDKRARFTKVMGDLVVADYISEKILRESDEIYIQSGWEIPFELSGLIAELAFENKTSCISLSAKEEKVISGFTKTVIYSADNKVILYPIGTNTMEKFLAAIDNSAKENDKNADLLTEKFVIKNEEDYKKLVDLANMFGSVKFTNCPNDGRAPKYIQLYKTEIKEFYVGPNRLHTTGGGAQIELRYEHLPAKEVIIFTIVLKYLEYFNTID